MARPIDHLPSERELSPAVRTKYEAYAAQGGLLGAFTYAAVVLETDDDDLAATLASIPTTLFVTSSLHDDAIDEADDWAGDRKRRLNEHVTLGDLAFTSVLEAANSLPAEIDLSPVLETVREIGRGQLGEEAVEPATATLEDAIARVDERGAVWADLAVSLIGASDGYSEGHLERLRTITRTAMFVLTVVDDVEDLPEDVANGVANVPIALYDGDLSASDSTAAAVESFLESDAPRRLEALLAERRAELEADVRDLAGSIDRSNEAMLDAVHRALTWYCESVCSTPVAQTVPPVRQREIRAQVAGDEAARRRAAETVVAGLPFGAAADSETVAAVDPETLTDAVVDLPADPLADVLVALTHVATVADGVMSTSLEEALATLERRAATTA
ncbi:hypothetical protein [Natronorubrum sp. FCH18a]|uniref:hypothetical protein n=1 Tax=Natronorubrum sp. FCH18a TaxID=3447018 RepID=UPI003F514E54